MHTDCELLDNVLYVPGGVVEIKLKLFGAPVYYGWYVTPGSQPAWVKVVQLDDGNYKVELAERLTDC